jgi:hypothetical protein
LVLDVLPREQKFNQDFFLVTVVSELPKENTSAKRRVGKNQQAVHINNSMCHNERKIREYFDWKTMMRISHPVYSPDLSLCDLCFFDYVKE